VAWTDLNADLGAIAQAASTGIRAFC